MGVFFPRIRDVWSGLTWVGWFGLSILVHFGLGGCGETLGISSIACGERESHGRVEFGVGSRVNGGEVFPFWLSVFD